MNLNGESGDWDNLQKNINLVIADINEDYGWNLLLSYGVIAEPVEVEVQIGKVPTIVVIPFHQFLLKVKGDLRIPAGEQVLTNVYMPIRFSPRREQELFHIKMPLRLVYDKLVRDESILTIQMPIRLSKWFQNELQQTLFEIKMPLRIHELRQELFSIDGLIKSVKMSQKKLKRRKKQIELLAEI